MSKKRNLIARLRLSGERGGRASGPENGQAVLLTKCSSNFA